MFTTQASSDVGFESMDAEHRVQLGLVSAFQQALEQRQDKVEVDEILDQLVSYTGAHFASEQLLMRLYAYPHYEAHVQEHDRLIEQITALQQHYQAGGVQAALEAGSTLRNWLMTHTLKTDQALGSFLSQQG